MTSTLPTRAGHTNRTAAPDLLVSDVQNMVHEVLLLLCLHRKKDVQPRRAAGHGHLCLPRCLAAGRRDQVSRKMWANIETVQDPIGANDGRHPDMYVGRGLAGVGALPADLEARRRALGVRQLDRAAVDCGHRGSFLLDQVWDVLRHWVLAVGDYLVQAHIQRTAVLVRRNVVIEWTGDVGVVDGELEARRLGHSGAFDVVQLDRWLGQRSAGVTLHDEPGRAEPAAVIDEDRGAHEGRGTAERLARSIGNLGRAGCDVHRTPVACAIAEREIDVERAVRLRNAGHDGPPALAGENRSRRAVVDRRYDVVATDHRQPQYHYGDQRPGHSHPVIAFHHWPPLFKIGA